MKDGIYFNSCKKDVITEKNDGIKNLKKKEIKCKEMSLWRGSNNLFIYKKKSDLRKNTKKIYVNLLEYKGNLV